ncbi:mucin-5B isoform X1 [Megalobrama amblycephala]|uniref:mucin-5B isoform X1 n=1 Tax=Megalobrama amblycephala TaxID=75352 RepID=UPI0020143FBF|nr:mucin-5B isoform X1 [Megalobrama amblycephala]
MSSKVFATWVVLATIFTLSTQSCITQWFDNDDPNDDGDYELLSDLLNMYPGEICPIPIDIEAQTVSGQPSSNVFQVYNPKIGLSCVNADQEGQICPDYKVRFTCPETWCSKCRTPWFDRDDPGGVGDYETLPSTLITYPLQVCAQPIAIEVTTITETPVLPGSQFPVYDPTQGFACKNAQQNGWCQDYKVRFTCPVSFCAPKCVTRWFDSDNPNTNGGDSELLTTLLGLYPGYICPNPLGIEAQTTSGLPASQTGNVFHVYNPTIGFSCINSNQKGGFCADYKVRFTCPEDWCSTCRTPWFDQDDPIGPGDDEMLPLILIAYPLQVCTQPIAIEVTTITGTPVLPSGSGITVYDPLQGFVCVSGACPDYRVRFTCPASFCGTKCVTRWFDSDNPDTNGGDSELLTTLLGLYAGYICPNPLGIEAQTTSGMSASLTENVFEVYNPTIGFSCVNANQGGAFCADYKVRFTCPEDWCSKCRTPWFDQDDPTGPGDDEKLPLILIAYPLQVCAQPIAIEVTTITGTPVLPSGSGITVYDPLQGFVCVNGACPDYRVRFTCPASFCGTKCVTSWFDSDNPNTNGGDSELLTTLLGLYPGNICPNPLGIEAQTTSGLSASQTGNVFQVYNPTFGFSCVNANQPGGICADYKVRFTCPEDWCSKCRTPWFDQDDPTGPGDDEKLPLILIAYPLQVCAQPIAIEVTTITGTPVLPSGSGITVYDPVQGFVCVNGACPDYRVRFTCPASFCGTKCVTRWFDSDNPDTNGGDSELLTTLLSLYPGYICPNPLGIEAQTTSGLPASLTGNVFQVYNPTFGFSCVNANQPGGICADYNVRFTCPEDWCSKCRTPWFDRDDPTGPGDNETLPSILIAYPLQVCAQPIAIEVTTITGTPVLPSGSGITVYDPLQGFVCVNGACPDYRVRFTCPASFCGTKCVTRWFDSDNPDTNGDDSELLTTLLGLYPGYICPNPLGIEAQTTSGLPASQTGNFFQVRRDLCRLQSALHLPRGLVFKLQDTLV